MGSSGSLGKSVDAAMNVGIDLFVVNPGGLEHCDRLLGGRRVVKIDEWAPIDFLMENRELGSKGFGVQCWHKGSVIPERVVGKREWQVKSGSGDLGIAQRSADDRFSATNHLYG